jgi:hypothetical protein
MELPDLITLYTGAWAEPDRERRQQLLERVWAEDGTYTDPTAHVAGRKALVDHIGGFFEQFVGARIELTSGIDAHHEKLRFTSRTEAQPSISTDVGAETARALYVTILPVSRAMQYIPENLREHESAARDVPDCLQEVQRLLGGRWKLAAFQRYRINGNWIAGLALGDRHFRLVCGAG